MNNIFLICPVRNIPQEYSYAIEDLVKHIEAEGDKVHWPPRDTNQNDPHGLDICGQNRNAIAASDIVYVIWDGKSQGCLFDLGMAFAMKKKVRVVTGYMPSMTTGKSFQNMIYKWEEDGPK